MKKHNLIVGIAIALATALMPLTPVVVSAQSNGLGITPRKDLTINPGSKIDDVIFINNLNKQQPLKLFVRVIDFQSKDETGAASLMQAVDAPTTAWSIKPFITIQKEVNIEAGKSTNIPFSIQIPENQGAGSYYSAIEYATNHEDAQKVTVAASSATLIFIKVPGQAKELLKLEQFGAYSGNRIEDNGVFKSIFTGDAPGRMVYRLKNEGNIAEQPSGSMLMKNMFGKQYKLIESANPRKELTLLGQTRRYEVCIDEKKDAEGKVTADCNKPKFWPGKYTATLSLLYGENGNESRDITATTSFWILPTWFIALVAIFLTIIIGLGVWLYRKAMNLRGSSRK